jgi:hypothetical protein
MNSTAAHAPSAIYRTIIRHERSSFGSLPPPEDADCLAGSQSARCIGALPSMTWRELSLAPASLRAFVRALPPHEGFKGTPTSSMEAYMDKLLKKGADWVIIMVFVAIALIILAASVKAEPRPGTGLLCNTQQEIVDLAAHAEAGYKPEDAIDAVNKASGETACGFVNFISSEIEVMTRMTVKGHDVVILKLTVMAVITPQGPVPAGIVQYTMAAAEGFVPARLGI